MEDIFRKEYAPLTDQQKAQVASIKESAEAIFRSWNEAVPKEERSERSRCMAIARTHFETAVMYAVKAITTKSEEV